MKVLLWIYFGVGCLSFIAICGALLFYLKALLEIHKAGK